MKIPNNEVRKAFQNLTAFYLKVGEYTLAKYTKDEKENLEELAQTAIHQIKEKQYDAELSGGVCYVGLAHCGKTVAVKWEG